MNTETEDRRSTQTPVRRPMTNAEFGMPDLRVDTSGESVPGYLWTVASGRAAFCSTCGAMRTTYGEIKGDEVLTCCPRCQRILSRDPLPAEGEQLTVDASDEFDQTRQHAHIPASLCPVDDCDKWPTIKGAAVGKTFSTFIHDHDPNPSQQPPRHVSPAIHEFRLEQLRQLREENRVLRERIAGFEHVTRRLAEHADWCEKHFEAVLGKSFSQAIADNTLPEVVLDQRLYEGWQTDIAAVIEQADGYREAA